MLRNVHDAHSPHALCRGAGHSSVCISCLVHALVAEPLLGLAEAVVHDACVASGDPQLAWQLASAVGDSDRSSPLLATYIASALASRSNDRSFCDKVLSLASCLCQASHTFWSALGGSLAQNIGTAPAQSALFNALADTATHFPAAQMPLDQFAAYVVDAANSALRAPTPRDVAAASRFIASVMGHRQPHDNVCHAVAAASPELAAAATAALMRWQKDDDACVACYELLTALTTAHLADLASCTDVNDAAQTGRWPIMVSIQTALLSSSPGVRVASARLCLALCSAGPGDLCAAAVEDCHLSEHLFEALRPTHGPQPAQEEANAAHETLQACTAALSALASHAECGPALGARLSVGAPSLAARLRAALASGDFHLAGRVAVCTTDILTAAAEGTQGVALARHQALGLAHALADGLAFVHDVMVMMVSSPSAARPQQPLMVLAPRLCSALTALVRTALQTFGADVTAVYEPACRCAAGIMASAVTAGCGGHTNDGGVVWLECIAPACDLVAAFTAMCRSGGASTSQATDVATSMCMLADTQLVPACMRAAECHPALHGDQGGTPWCASWFALMASFLHQASAVPIPMRAELALKLAASRGVALALKVAAAQPAARPAVSEWMEALLGAHPATADLMPAGHSCAEAMLHITHVGATLDTVLAAVRAGTPDVDCRALFLLLFASLHSTSGMQPMPSCGASCHAAQAALGTYITSAAVSRLSNTAWCTVLVHLWASCSTEGHHRGLPAEATLLSAYVRAVDASGSTITPAGNSNTCRWLFSCIAADDGVRRHCEALMAAWVTRPQGDDALGELLRTDAGACGVLLDVVIVHACHHGGASKAVLAGALNALHAAAWHGADAVANALRPRLERVGDALFDIMLQPASQEVTPPLMRALCALLRAWSPPPPLGQRFDWMQAGIAAAAAVEQGANQAAAAAPIDGGGNDAASAQIETLVMPCAQLLACSIRLEMAAQVAREPIVMLAVAACLQPRSPLACRAIGVCLAAQLALVPGMCADLCSRTRTGVVVARQLAQCALHHGQGDNGVQAQKMVWAALAALCLIVEQCGARHPGMDADLAAAAAHAHAAGAPPHATHRTRAMAWRLMRALAATGHGVASAWSPFLAQEAARHVTEVASLSATGFDDPDARVSATEAAAALGAVLQASRAAAAAVPAPLANEAASAASALAAAGGGMYPSTPDRLSNVLLPPWPLPDAALTSQAEAMHTQ